MATFRNKRKLAAVTRETQEEDPRNGQSRNTSVPRINEDNITQVFEEIEGRVTKKLSQEYSKTESRILGALSKLEEFLLNQQIRTHSGTVPETFGNTNADNQGTNEDDSQSDPHPEAGLFCSQTTQNSGPEVGPYRTNNIFWFSHCFTASDNLSTKHWTSPSLFNSQNLKKIKITSKHPDLFSPALSVHFRIRTYPKMQTCCFSLSRQSEFLVHELPILSSPRNLDVLEALAVLSLWQCYYPQGFQLDTNLFLGW